MLEIEQPAMRSSLWFGIRSGYLIAFGFVALAFAAAQAGVVAHHWGFYALLAAKLGTNTLATLCLRRGRWVLETQTLNTVMDLVTLTGAIYLTGGPLSPLFGVYFIVIAVLATLTNVGVTVLASVLAFLLHATATILVAAGVLPFFPPPGAPGATPLTEPGQVAVALVYAAALLAVTGLFISLLVRKLRTRTEELEARTAQLIAANAQRTLLLANVTHELRTPIHGICGLSDVLDAEIYGPVTPEQREAHESIRGAATTLLQRVDDLLALARAEAGAMKLALSEVELDGLLASVVGAVRWMVGTKELRLEVERDPQVPAHVTTDRGKLSQILVNLLANAVKFTPHGGEVRLRVRVDAGDILFEVADTGPGIDAETLPRLFEPFEQGDASDEREYGGTGLGLAIVRRLSSMIRGTVTVESAVGQGSTFRVCIPPALESDDSGQVLLDVSGTHPLG